MCELAPLCYFGTDTNYRQVGIRLLVVQSESFSGTCTIARVGLLKKLKELMMTLWWPWRHSVATLPTLECETTGRSRITYTTATTWTQQSRKTGCSSSFTDAWIWDCMPKVKSSLKKECRLNRLIIATLWINWVSHFEDWWFINDLQEWFYEFSCPKLFLTNHNLTSPYLT